MDMVYSNASILGWCLTMNRLNDMLKNLSHDYLLLAIAAVLFFSVKAVLGYITYRHYDHRLKEIEKKLDRLASRHG